VGTRTAGAGRSRLELLTDAIDLDHNGERVGSVTYVEITPANQLAVVGVLDSDEITKLEQPVYWSGTYGPSGVHGSRQRSFVVPRARVFGMSLTYQPANTTARAGGLAPRRPPRLHRSLQWPCGWRTSDPLLDCALSYLGTDWQVRIRSASRIVDRRDDGDYLWHLLPRHRFGGTAAAEPDALGRPTGPWRHGPRSNHLRPLNPGLVTLTCARCGATQQHSTLETAAGAIGTSWLGCDCRVVEDAESVEASAVLPSTKNACRSPRRVCVVPIETMPGR
jgi:hypothetical protein